MMELASARKLIKSFLAATIANEYELVPLGAGERAFVHQFGLHVRRRTATDFDKTMVQQLLGDAQRVLPRVVVECELAQ